MGVAFACDQVLALVHPVDPLLAACIAGTDRVSNRLAGSAPVSIVGYRRQWSSRPDLDHCDAAGASGAQIDRTSPVTPLESGLRNSKRTDHGGAAHGVDESQWMKRCRADSDGAEP